MSNTEPVSFGDFEALAEASNQLSPEHTIGFDPRFRRGFEGDIAASIFRRLSEFGRIEGPLDDVLVDIGCGFGALTDAITAECRLRALAHVLVDSPRMLDRVEPGHGRLFVGGRFPDNMKAVLDAGRRPRFVLAYSVAQYSHREGLFPAFIDGIESIMSAGTVALIGDLPNRDLKNRVLVASGRDTMDFDPSREFGDDLIIQTVAAFRRRGLSCYLLPQHPGLPLSPHREDLLVLRHV